MQHVAAPLPDRGDRVVPRRARRKTASCCSAGPTRSSARTTPSSAAPARRPGQTLRRARIEMHTYLAELIERHRREPGDDIVSELIAAEIDGEPLTEMQLLSYCELIVEAGNETTRNAISGGLLALDQHRDQWERLRADPDLLPGRGRGDAALRHADHPLHAHRDGGRRGPRRPRSTKATSSPCSSRRGTATTTCSTTRSRSGSTAARTRTSRSASVSTSAWARTWPAWRWRRCSTTCSARLESFEVTGPVERLNSAVNGGIKHLPVRCRLA